MRKFSFVLAAIVALSGASVAQADTDASETCVFSTKIKPKISVGDCEGTPLKKTFLVKVNTRTIAKCLYTKFSRIERNCDDKKLSTVDVLTDTSATVTFTEWKETSNANGSGLEVVTLGDDAWCVTPHNGGYYVTIKFSRGGQNYTKDAGLYCAQMTVCFTMQPHSDYFEDYK